MSGEPLFPPLRLFGSYALMKSALGMTLLIYRTRTPLHEAALTKGSDGDVSG